MAAEPISDTSYQAHRLTISVTAPFDDVHQRYEEAVPAYDSRVFQPLIDERADWSEMLDLMNRTAPCGFLNYWSFDAQPLMGLAGDPARCAQYLMGNHTIAERMFRHDPKVLIYVPLRVTLSSDGDTRVQFSIERPSSVLSSFANEDIAAVGVELDHKVAALLAHLDLPVPPSLLAG